MDNLTSPQSPIVAPKRVPVATFFLIALGLVIVFSFLRFYVFKNYNITIETECNPEIEICFTRDCEAEECPPNNLNNYKKYIIKGFQFDKCDQNGTCAKFCSSPKNCEQIKCDSEVGDECVGL